jgi:hypothetical protein
LNGLQPGPPACNTFRRGDDKSCIDYIMTNNRNCSIRYDPTTLMGLSDHVFTKTSIDIPYLINRQNISSHPHREETSYKWIEGTNITEYSQSAKTWTAHTQEAAFIDQL